MVKESNKSIIDRLRPFSLSKTLQKIAGKKISKWPFSRCLVVISLVLLYIGTVFWCLNQCFHVKEFNNSIIELLVLFFALTKSTNDLLEIVTYWNRPWPRYMKYIPLNNHNYLTRNVLMQKLLLSLKQQTCKYNHVHTSPRQAVVFNKFFILPRRLPDYYVTRRRATTNHSCMDSW